MSTPTIPRKGISEPSVAVHRPSDTTIAGPSMPTSSPEYHDDERPTTPPPYSGPISPSMRAPPTAIAQTTYPGLPSLNYTLYAPPNFTLSTDKTTITSYEPRLSIYPAALLTLIKDLCTIPPKPTIRIIGKNESMGTLDFDLEINCMNLIVPQGEKREEKAMNYVKVIGNGEMGLRGEGRESKTPGNLDLEGWVRKYCENQSAIKHFVLERTVINWDTSYLEGRLLSLISSTGYKGHTTVTFPITHSKVIVHSPDKYNRFFSDVQKAFTGTKKYEVVKSVWPYADVQRGDQGRRCMVQEEEDWFLSWRDAIRHAALSRRRGWVTVEDRLEFLMEPKVSDAQKPGEWGT